jgi:cytochrome c oxidase assembly factor CtaG
VVLGVLHALAVIAVHVPAFYDGALSSWAVHGTGHVLLLVTGGTWLAAVVHRAERADPVAPVVSLLVVATTGAVLGAFLMFAPSPLYAHGTVADQQLAGALMGVAGATYAAAGVVLTARMIGRLAAPRRTRVPPESRAARSGGRSDRTERRHDRRAGGGRPRGAARAVERSSPGARRPRRGAVPA